MTNDTTPKNNSGKTRLIIAGIAALLIAAYGVYAINGSKSNNQGGEKTGTVSNGSVVAAPEGLTKALSTGGMQAFLMHKTRKEMPKLEFKNEQGKELTLENWKGRVVLLNLWATWCAPCRKEMPHLANLQKQLGGDDFEVVAISIDRKGVEASKKFLSEVNASALKLYMDRTTVVLRKVKARGLPVTVLIDRQGREVGRLLGPAVWDGVDAVRLVKTAIGEGE